MAKSNREEVYQAIDSERDYQESLVKANYDDAAPRHSLEEFVLYMDDYMRELKTQLSRTWGPNAYVQPLNTIRKVVALGVAAMEAHGAIERTF